MTEKIEQQNEHKAKKGSGIKPSAIASDERFPPLAVLLPPLSCRNIPD
jgi:hypothetical protein